MDDDLLESHRVNNLLFDGEGKHPRNSRANYYNIDDNENLRRSTLSYFRDSMRES